MSLLTGKNGLLNSDSIAEAAKGKVTYVDAEDIVSNALNRYELEDVDDLAENIKEKGLLEPLQGVKDEDGIVTLLSGHRRYAAIIKLLGAGEQVRYAGKDLNDGIPVIILQETDPLEQRVLIMSFNAYRTMKKDERRRVILEAHDVYEKSCKAGRRPAGREREWITSVTGISDGSVGKVLAELHRSEESKIFEEKDSDSATVTKEVNEYKKVSKAFRNAADHIQLAKDLINEGMDPVDYRELKDLIRSLKVDLDRVIPTLPVITETDYLRVYLTWNNEIRTFAERGDLESVLELLSEKSKIHEGGTRDKYAWNFGGGKFSFSEYESGMNVSIPIKRFAKMLVERAKLMNGVEA